MNKKIILFTKAPHVGYGKSRLKGFLTEQERLELCKKLIYDTVSILEETKEEIVIYFAGKKNDLDFLTYPKKKQCGVDLGERMAKAMQEELKLSDRVLLLGSDLENLKASMIEKAFRILDEKDVVIIPTKDGGFGLIGMKEYHDIFTGITYGIHTVFKQITQKIQQKNLTYQKLKEIFDIDTIEDLVRAQTGSLDVELLGYGEYNMNYLIDHSYIFRINRESQLHLGKHQIEYEYQALRLLENSGVTPKVFQYQLQGEFIPYGTLTMEYLKGRPLNYDTDLQIAAKLLSTIHNFNYDKKESKIIHAKQPFLMMYEEFYQMFDVYKKWSKKQPEVESRIQELLEIAKGYDLKKPIERPCIINTELNSGNFIIGDKSYVIDWEKPLIGECEQDIAHFLVPTTTNWKTKKILSKEEQENFLKEYEKYRKIDRKKLQQYMMFNCLRGLTWCSMAKVEYDGERAISNHLTYEKIKKFLTTEFLDKMKERYFEKNNT